MSNPTRLATQGMAERIVEAVRAEQPMPLQLDVVPVHGTGHHYRHTDVESLIAALATEVTLLRAERDEAIRLCAKAMIGGDITHNDGKLLSDFCKLIGYEP